MAKSLLADSIIFHLDAASLFNLSDGDKVSKWEDQSKRGFHVYQENESSKPTYRQSVIRGMPAVQFDDSNEQWLGDTGFDLEQPCTVFAVVQVLCEDQTHNGIFANQGSAWGLGLSARNNGHWESYAGTHLAGNSGQKTWNNEVNLLTTVYNEDNSAFYLNGDLDVTGSIGNRGIDDLSIGAFRPLDQSRFMNGYIFEIVVFDKPLDIPEIETVESYLKGKWNNKAAIKINANKKMFLNSELKEGFLKTYFNSTGYLKTKELIEGLPLSFHQSISFKTGNNVLKEVVEIKESTTLTIPESVEKIDFFMVGGGGGAGHNGGGGGGAGGVIMVDDFAVTPGETFSVEIGKGGSVSSNGGDTTFGDFTALGGGYGNSRGQISSTGGDGGSGGGGNSNNAGGTSGGEAINSEQGSDGGNGFGAGGNGAGGGGGGFNSPGSSGSDRQGGDGGDGIFIDIDGEERGFAGGGAGSGLDYNGFSGNAGSVQIGAGGGGPENGNINGRPNSGGGGGAGMTTDGTDNRSVSSPGYGGSGIVIVWMYEQEKKDLDGITFVDEVIENDIF